MRPETPPTRSVAPDPADARARTAAAAVLAAFAFVSVWYTGTFAPFGNPNEVSRLETVVAAVDHGTLAIDAVIPVLGDHEDKSVSDGRTYSNKAPGLALAAVPVYALLRLGLAPAQSPFDAIAVLIRILTVTAASLAALARLRRRLAGEGSAAAAALVLCGAAFGTSYVFYARSFFGHAWTAALLFLAWDFLRSADEAGPSRRAEWLLAASGLAAGWSAISEYTAAPIAGLLALRALSLRPARRILPFAAGLAAALAALAAYDTVCFGSPWVLSSAREAQAEYAALAAQGFFGFGPPQPAVMLKFLISPERGVLAFSPFLLWCVPGFVRWWRSGRGRRDCALAAAATLATLVLMSGYPNWHGGWSLGSRYLLPALFFSVAALPHALRSPLSRGLFAAAVVFSAGSHALLAGAFPHFPDNVPWPAATGSAWFLARGWAATTLAGASPATLAPAALAIAAALALSLRAADGPLPQAGVPRTSVVALLGAAPLLILLARPPALPYAGRLWRAAMFGAFSGKDPAREQLRAVALEAATPAEQRRALAVWRTYGPGP